MLKQKRSKVSRARGSNSHGWGHKKKHRGSGHRGGFGLAGTGARGDSQKAGLLAMSERTLKKITAVKGIKLKDLKKKLSKVDYFGKNGFSSIHKRKLNVLSISYLENNFDKLLSNGLISKEKEEYIFDSTIHGYNKILGKSNFSKKITLICFDISQSAKEKIESAGGKVVILGSDENEE